MKTFELIFDHVDGLSNIYILDAAGLLRIDRNFSDGTAKPVFASGTEGYQLTVLDGFTFSENLTFDERGATYDVQIKGFIPRIGQAHAAYQLETGAWIAIVQDANGDILLCGSKDVPLTCSTEKAAGTGRNGIAFTLKGVEPKPAAIISKNSFLEEVAVTVF